VVLITNGERARPPTIVTSGWAVAVLRTLPDALYIVALTVIERGTVEVLNTSPT
jgi:hypothetical protein